MGTTHSAPTVAVEGAPGAPHSQLAVMVAWGFDQVPPLSLEPFSPVSVSSPSGSNTPSLLK